MSVLLCFLLPPIFLMYVREKMLGDKIECKFHGNAKEFLREYLLTLCFLNFTILAVTYKLFHHDGPLDSSLLEYTGFTFHYLLLAFAIAIAEPILENIFRYHLKFELHKVNIHVNVNLFLYAYSFVLVAMNLLRIFDNAFWGDEGYSIRMAQMSVSDMVLTTAGDVHPPLYYLLAQLLYHTLGNNGFTYHLSALLPYIVIVIIGCIVVRKYFGIIPATVLVTMSSLMKNAVTYNVEARMYALGAMFVLIAYIAFYKIIDNNHPCSWIAFCISSLGAAYTHYYALISVAFLFVMLMPLSVLQKKYRKGLVISYLTAIIAYLPWLMILVKSFGRTASSWWLTSIPGISDCYRFLLDYKWLAVVFLACFLIFAMYQMDLLSIHVSKAEKLKDCIDIGLRLPEAVALNDKLYWAVSGIIAICGTVAVGLALSYMVRPFLVLRYLFPVSAMLYLIFGVCISEMKFSKLWSVLLIIAILWNNVPAYAQKYNSDHNLDQATAKFLDAVKPEKDVELVTNNSHLGWTLLSYYYPENVSKYDGDAPANLDKDYEDIWLIWEGELDEAAEANIRRQHYTSEMIYEGCFANGPYYRVYQLHRKK